MATKDEDKRCVNSLIIFNPTGTGASPFYPVQTKVPCWWCRVSFDSSPIGCPLDIVTVDEINKNNELSDFFKKANLTVDEEIFIVEGYFCCFECVRQYISENGDRAPYRNSVSLLYRLRDTTLPEMKNSTIKNASSWKLLKHNGGSLTVEEYRKINGSNYVYDSEIFSKPKMFSAFSQTIVTQKETLKTSQDKKYFVK